MIHLFQRLVKEVLVRKVMKIIGVIILAIAAVVAAFVIKGVIVAKKPSIK